MINRRNVLVGPVLAALAGCVPDSMLQAGPEARDYSIDSIDVAAASDALVTPFSLDGLSEAEQVETIKREIRKALAERMGKRKGRARKARLEVVLRFMDVASSAGRVLRGNDSEIRAEVRLVDAKTRKIVAFHPNVRGVDRGMQGVGAAAGIVSLAVNIATADATYARAAETWVDAVERWLGP